jgi:selenocysteine lyase/cysteine desulfurase
VTFSKTGAEAAALQSHLYQQGINTSISKRNNARLDLGRETQGDVIRVSMHYYNSRSEIERFIQVIDRF